MNGENNGTFNNQSSSTNQNLNNNYYQNQNTGQNINNNQPSFDTMSQSNNMYNQPTTQNSNPYTNNNYNFQNFSNIQQPNNTAEQPINHSNSNTNNNQNKTKIIGIVIIAVVILIVGIMLFGGKDSSSSNNGYTVNYGQTLKVNELNGVYDFDLEVLSIEKNYSVDSWIYTGECLAIRVSIKNNSESNLDPALLKFAILNLEDNKISTATYLSQSLLQEAQGLDLSTTIESGKTISGYIFFYETDENGNNLTINSNDISKLEIKVPKELSNNDGVITGDYEQYYIELK